MKTAVIARCCSRRTSPFLKSALQPLAPVRECAGAGVQAACRSACLHIIQLLIFQGSTRRKSRARSRTSPRAGVRRFRGQPCCCQRGGAHGRGIGAGGNRERVDEILFVRAICLQMKAGTRIVNRDSGHRVYTASAACALFRRPVCRGLLFSNHILKPLYFQCWISTVQYGTRKSAALFLTNVQYTPHRCSLVNGMIELLNY